MASLFPSVLQVLPSLKSGGVEKATIDMVKGIKFYYPQIPTFVASQGGVLVEEIIKEGGEHITLPLEKRMPFMLGLNTYSLIKECKKHTVELIHARSRFPAWSSLWAARFLKLPIITTYHGTYSHHNMIKKFYNSIMARGDKVIAISNFIAEYIGCHHPHLKAKVTTIPEGIDINYFDSTKINPTDIEHLKQVWQVPTHHKIILLPGRLTSWKGQEVLLDALKLMPKNNITVILLGSDQGRTEYRKNLEQKAKNLPVKFIEDCKDVRLAYAAADIVVSCSTKPEAFGRVTAEALAMGKAVVGTNHGATPEQCIHEKTGFLVIPNNAKELAEILTTVLNNLDSEKILNITNQAKIHIQNNFSLTKMVTQTLALYQSVLQREKESNF